MVAEEEMKQGKEDGFSVEKRVCEAQSLARLIS